MRAKLRAGSPPCGGSSLITSAPQSARTAPAAAPAIHTPSSTTLTPSSGPGTLQTLRVRADHARSLERVDLAIREPEYVAQDLAVVLAEGRSRARQPLLLAGVPERDGGDGECADR